MIKTIENEYAFDNFFMNKTSGIIYAGIIGKLYDFSKATDYYREYGEWGNIDMYGGFQTIDTRNNHIIKIQHMSKNLLRGISSGMQVMNLSWMQLISIYNQVRLRMKRILIR